jgi:hypothetical protein
MMRTTSDVIETAMRENRRLERLLLLFAGLLIATGTAVSVWLSARGQALGALVGLLLGALSWPALHAMLRIQRENMMIRLLEVPLSKAHTAAEAAAMLKGLFAFVEMKSPDGATLAVRVNPSSETSINDFLNKSEGYANEAKNK